jgi:hypothetical protein
MSLIKEAFKVLPSSVAVPVKLKAYDPLSASEKDNCKVVPDMEPYPEPEPGPVLAKHKV